MQPDQFSLLKDRRFLPLFVTQFLGAFHDNVFKNALVVLILYDLHAGSETDSQLLVTIAAALFILPFVLFSAIGGQLADKYPKNEVIKIIKLAEIGIGVMGMAALFIGWVPFSFAVLFALGAQSAFFGPCKYAILPDHLKPEELIAGNALLNTGTYLSILFGTIAGTMLITLGAGKLIVGLLLISSALVGFTASRYIPTNIPKSPALKLAYNPLAETFDILRYAFTQKPGVVRAILGVAWFYFLGGMFMAQFANYTKGTLYADESVLAFFLVVFSLGVAAGGLLNNSLLRGKVEATFVPLAALGITLFSVDLYFASNLPARTDLFALGAFLTHPAHWRIILDIWMIAFCGGLFVVPLNAIIQYHTEAEKRARIVAASAIMDAIFIFASSAFAAALILAGFYIRDIFLTFAVMNAVVAVYFCIRLPECVLKSFAKSLLRRPR